MAKDPGQEKSIEQLRQEIAHSRDRLARDLTGLRYEFDFGLKFRKSFQRRTGVWVSAALLLGTVFTMRGRTHKKQTIIFGRRRGDHAKKGEEQKKGLLGAGLAMGGLRLAATLLRPVVVSFITKKAGAYAARSSSAPKW